MEYIKLKQPPARLYRNNGQHAEQVVKYTFTNELKKADNTPFWIDADFNGIQIKSARATVCNDLDFVDHLKRDKARKYGYVISDFSLMVLMDKKEYVAFVSKFGSVQRASSRTGGQLKIRLKHESKDMLKWLGL